MDENNIQIEQQPEIEQQSEAQAKRLLAYYSYLRKSQKMTQSELERITGLSRIAINRCENGKLMPTIRSMNKLLAPLGYQLGIVSLDEPDSGYCDEGTNEIFQYGDIYCIVRIDCLSCVFDHIFKQTF